MTTNSVPSARDQGKDRFQITNQFRDRGTMVYEFKGRGLCLSFRISERSDDPLPWEVAVFTTHAPFFPTLTAVATSRGEALAGLERAWHEAGGFPLLDWPCIREALAAVRGI